MGIFSSSNPADAAMPYITQAQDETRRNYQPYIKHGNDAYDSYAPNSQQMASHPVDYYNSLINQYQESPGYKSQLEDALGIARNTAAAGGMLGTPYDQVTQGKIGASLRSQDMQQWINNILGIQHEGTGHAEHLYDTGYDATKTMTSDINNMYGQKAQLAFQGDREKNSRFSSIVRALTGAGLGYATGGLSGVVGGLGASSKFI